MGIQSIRKEEEVDCLLPCQVLPFARTAFPCWPDRQTPTYPFGPSSKAASSRKPAFPHAAVRCPCSVLHALFFSLELELLEGWVRTHSRVSTELAQRTYSGGVRRCLPTFPPRPGATPPHEFFLCGLPFPFLFPPPSSPFSELLSLLSILFSPFPPTPASPSGPLAFSSPAPSLPPAPWAPSTLPGSCSSPGGLQGAVLRRPLGRRAARARFLCGQVGGSGLGAAVSGRC